MESGDQEALQQAVTIQSAHLEHHDKAVQKVTEKLAQVPAALSALTDWLNAAPTDQLLQLPHQVQLMALLAQNLIFLLLQNTRVFCHQFFHSMPVNIQQSLCK